MQGASWAQGNSPGSPDYSPTRVPNDAFQRFLLPTLAYAMRRAFLSMADTDTSGDRLRLFVSYSRRDMATADTLVTALEGEGFEITIDRRDLPYGERAR